MSQIEQVFQDAFDAEVKRAYGNVGMLQGTVYTKTGVVGKQIQFRKKGKGLARQHVPNAERVPANAEFTPVICPLQDWEVFDFSDRMSKSKINFNEIKELAEITGDALGLRKDQLIIDALKAGATQTAGTSGAKLTVATLTAARAKLMDNGVPEGNLTFIHSAKQLQDLMDDVKITSSDYAEVKALVHGQIKDFLGFHFICIAKRLEGGLPTDSSGVTGYVYDKRAVGFALGQDIVTEMEYLADRGCYIVGGSFSAGAVVIDAEGVVAVVSKKN